MNRFWEKVGNFFYVLASYGIAIARLFFWVLVLITSGLQKIIFCRVEICSVEVKGIPLLCDREDMLSKLSYVDKLRVTNPELAEMPYEEEEYSEEDEYNEEDEEDNGEN